MSTFSYKKGEVFDAQTEARINALDEQFAKDPDLLYTLSEKDVHLFCTAQLRKLDSFIDRVEKARRDLRTKQKELYLMGLELGTYTARDTKVLQFIEISDLSLSSETTTILASLDVKTLADLMELSVLDFFSNPSCFKEVILLLDRYNLSI